MPVLLSVAQLVRPGNQPAQFQLGGRYWLDGPDGTPECGIRLAVTFLSPT